MIFIKFVTAQEVIRMQVSPKLDYPRSLLTWLHYQFTAYVQAPCSTTMISLQRSYANPYQLIVDPTIKLVWLSINWFSLSFITFLTVYWFHSSDSFIQTDTEAPKQSNLKRNSKAQKTRKSCHKSRLERRVLRGFIKLKCTVCTEFEQRMISALSCSMTRSVMVLIWTVEEL